MYGLWREEEQERHDSMRGVRGMRSAVDWWGRRVLCNTLELAKMQDQRPRTPLSHRISMALGNDRG